MVAVCDVPLKCVYLKPLDDLMERLDLPYVRYMDDWVILAKTRWALRHSRSASEHDS